MQVWFVVLVFLLRIQEAGFNYSTSLKLQNIRCLKWNLQVFFISKMFLNIEAVKCVLFAVQAQEGFKMA